MARRRLRTVSSLFMLFSFAVLVPSGIALHVATDAGTEGAQHVAMTIHNVSALVFLISALIHIGFNRASIVSTLRSKTGRYPLVTGTSAVVAIVFIFILAVAILHTFILG
jgi:hypothetical protein